MAHETMNEQETARRVAVRMLGRVGSIVRLSDGTTCNVTSQFGSFFEVWNWLLSPPACSYVRVDGGPNSHGLYIDEVLHE